MTSITPTKLKAAYAKTGLLPVTRTFTETHIYADGSTRQFACALTALIAAQGWPVERRADPLARTGRDVSNDDTDAACELGKLLGLPQEYALAFATGWDGFPNGEVVKSCGAAGQRGWRAGVRCREALKRMGVRVY